MVQPLIDMHSFSVLVGEINAAALDSARWPKVLEQMSRISGDICTHMFGFDSLVQKSVISTEYGYAPEFTKSFEEYYGNLNAWAPGFAKHGVGETVPSGRMISDRDLFGTEFYADWVRPQENIIGGGGAILKKDRHRLFLIGGNIRATDRERLEANWLELVKLCVPHIQSALDTSRLLAGYSLDWHLRQKQIDSDGAAAIVLTDDHRPIVENALARQWIEKGDIIQIAPSGRLRFARFEDDLAFSRATSVFRSGGRFVTLTVNGVSYHCNVVPIGNDAIELLPYPENILLEERFTVLLMRRVSLDSDPASAITRRFGLTQIEANNALALGRGLTAHEIAEARGVSIHTVRNQIKAAMSKLGVRRQVDLIRAIGRVDH